MPDNEGADYYHLNAGISINYAIMLYIICVNDQLTAFGIIWQSTYNVPYSTFSRLPPPSSLAEAKFRMAWNCDTSLPKLTWNTGRYKLQVPSVSMYTSNTLNIKKSQASLWAYTGGLFTNILMTYGYRKSLQTN